MFRRNKASQNLVARKLTEEFAERTAGIWVPFVFYAVGGVYMLAFWGLFNRTAYHLLVLGGLSIIIAVAVYSLSRWAYWLGIFTFPLLFALFAYALTFSVNVVGWYSTIPNTLLNVSMILYLVFLTLSFLLLIDRRNTLKNDRILDMLRTPLAAPSAEKKTQQ
jgi:hypothetical protein